MYFGNRGNPVIINAQVNAERLKDAIQVNDRIGIAESIKELIKSKVIVTVQFEKQLYECSEHNLYYPNEINRFSIENLIITNVCSHGHKVCFKCGEIYIKQNFQHLGIENSYNCPCCYRYQIRNTRFLNDDDLRYLLIQIYGLPVYEELYKLKYDNRPTIVTNSKPCPNCNNVIKMFSLCNLGHEYCESCLKSWVSNLGANPVACPSAPCQGAFMIKSFIEALGATDYVYRIKSQLEQRGIYLNYCPECKSVVELSQQDEVTTCKTCAFKICSKCGLKEHFGLTCFYFFSVNDYDVIDLPEPKNPGRPASLLEDEYLKAKYAFNTLIDPVAGLEFNSAKLIVNRELEKKYSDKKNKMAVDCGGKDKIGEIYIWHGSKYENYDRIMKGGFKIGGVDPEVPIANGMVHGLGIYSALTPNTPAQYAKDSRWVLCCLALKGNHSQVKIEDKNLLDNPNTHSYIPKGAPRNDWMVFFTKEQTLPRYLIEHRAPNN
jgi:Poly(ADP-ribose) polymerase catalytic domain/IBR domain, a half RING-finger domain